MAANAQKVPLARSINDAAAKRASDAIAVSGKSLPCRVVAIDGWIVEVSFELLGPFTLPNVTVPVASSLYDYLPLRPGDPGVVRAADVRLGGISGLGAGTASPVGLVGNLSALVFEPIGNAAWQGPDVPFIRIVQGPDGVTVQTLDGNVSIKLTVDGNITINPGSSGKLTINGDISVTGAIEAAGEVTAGFGGADSVTLQLHKHGTGSPAAGTSVPTAGT